MLYILAVMLTIFYCACVVLWLYGRTWRMNEAEEVLMRIREESRTSRFANV